MGVSGKWIKALVGLKKSQKSPSNKDEEKVNGSQSHSKSLCSANCSVGTETENIHDQLNCNYASHVGDANEHFIPDPACSLSTCFDVQKTDHHQQILREELAAARIQTAFRGFLARRALSALKGLVRLQALIRGHSVRKQAAMTLRCMQALVRVQAHVRARRVRLALESQTAEQKFKQQTAKEAQVRQIEQEGWCDHIGSAEEIQAKLVKRQEAAAKRERAMAYSLAHQWQAGSKQLAAPTGFEPDKSSWGWTWLERWMAVRPWENRFLDINIGDGMTIQESGSAQSADDTRAQSKSASKKPGSTNLCNQKRGSSQTNVVGSSSSKSLNKMPSDQAVPSKPESKLVNDGIQLAQARLGRSSRSQSNPKERSVPSDKQAKKRFSLPNSGSTVGAPTAKNPSRTAASRKLDLPARRVSEAN
ncbi:protein IQ-DOMAIN 1 isoform X1 [Eucalyptus grandis]|uniref:protein IQ-DOMAIN 1 isoform X1 n=1 Tax=Eucalyptus grandis TaxID=71139 RepID=UPI00192EAFD8|nr:protein IQ-DOMAIN 1 isoform X1 [Eucalyptus grandis]